MQMRKVSPSNPLRSVYLLSAYLFGLKRIGANGDRERMDDLKDICELLGILRLKELIDLLLQLLAQRFFVFRTGDGLCFAFGTVLADDIRDVVSIT